MDVGITALLTVVMGAMMFFVQRAEPKRRLLVAVVFLVGAELIRRYVWYKELHTEAWVALGVALLINFLFWLFIGRYNPVGSSDRIQVIGMDD
jgi:hypothetical protein